MAENEQKPPSTYPSAKELQPCFHEFLEWLKDLFPEQGEMDEKCTFKPYDKFGVQMLYVEICTNTHTYAISVNTQSQAYDRGYIGATVSCREPRESEDWVRGHDLPDGAYSRETFDKIIHAIAMNEFAEGFSTAIKKIVKTEESK